MTIRPRLILTGLAAAGAAAGVLFLLYQLPIWLAADELRRLDTKDGLAAAATLRGQFVPVVTVVLGLVGLLYTARKFFLDRASQHIDRFNTAVEHLDSESSVRRAGGAWALQAIMEDAPREQPRGRRLLAHFLREQTTERRTGLAGEHLAALEVLRSYPAPGRWSRDTPEPLDLTGIRVPRADLHRFYLHNALMSRTELTGADLTDAVLTRARLDRSTLIGTNLRGADLSGATLVDARLNEADLTGARLTGADLTGAALSGTILTGAVLSGTILTGANLLGTDLRAAIGLTSAQLDGADTDSTTRYPPHLSELPT
ncbi:pentapeptide repeat-containing protein [Nocardia sp. NPDC127579]|uniref:pentapeptide repeat-containing protein n=1 Tax=Nocardia sp. NPDC127579 TaxID=3345402 RepID=UPI00363D786A